MTAKDPVQAIGRGFTIVAWLLLLGGGYWFFQKQLDKRHNPNQQLVSETTADGLRVVTLAGNRQGHFVGTVQLNGFPIQFLLDTGASTIAVDEQTAEKIGMKKGLPYQVSTANGMTRAYSSHIQQLQLGSIELRDVPAAIVPNLGTDEILLGMSALKQLEFTQRNNQLVLTQHPVVHSQP